MTPQTPEQAAAISDIATGERLGDSERAARGRTALLEANLAADVRRRLEGKSITEPEVERITARLEDLLRGATEVAR